MDKSGRGRRHAAVLLAAGYLPVRHHVLPLMLRFYPKSIFSWDFSVTQTRQGIEEEVALLDISPVRERGTIQIGDRDIYLRRTSIFRRRYEVTEDDRVLMEAVRPGLFRRRYILRASSLEWVLEPWTAFRRGFELRLGETLLGRIEPDSAFRRRGKVDLPDDLPLELQLICLWFVLVAWKRQQAAASSGGH